MPAPELTSSAADVVVIGAGAAGIGAGRRLLQAGRSFVILEARERIGGRAWTERVGGDPIDFGCGWLHSADRNPWVAIAESHGFAIDRRPPTWGVQAGGVGFKPGEEQDLQASMGRFFERLEAEDEDGPDRPAADLLEPGDRWSPLIDAVNTYVNGTELSKTSLRDYVRYADTDVNWRVPDGYGAVVAAHGRDLPVLTGCAVTAVDHSGRTIRVETTGGTVEARAVIVTLPPTLLAAGAVCFTPDLPDKREAAEGLPLGVADKLFLALDRPEELPAGHVFGRTDRAGTGSYHLKPFGRPLIEGYFGGTLARDLEAGGVEAFAAFATDELAGLFGEAIRGRLRVVAATAWASDPLARGSYSAALPGRADERARLAAPVDGRLFFAGEATSRHDFSTAHGAYRTGVRAAEEALAGLGPA
ncbi:flavin monoamine oxidase family protein [Chthonobacter albigriseus]|uniref:flavin monoamine oxidase family protein n=1 Tax=Chthonobacter albigriseus TaxID=1683161 RepID=UPI001FCE44F5|nr:NAD(P)/FAD-dependent oxidoreductase [Chthonobacter albigriseus]